MTDTQHNPAKHENEVVFKTCSGCGEQWLTRADFFADPELKFVGYQAFVQDGVLGLFLFNHGPCGTTLAIRAAQFQDLREGVVYEQSSGRTEPPAPSCLTARSGQACPQLCECAFVHHVSETIDARPPK